MMGSIFEREGFVFIWLGFLLLMSLALSWVLIWAIRARQFSNQDRARYLPLESAIPPRKRGDGGAPRESGGRP